MTPFAPSPAAPAAERRGDAVRAFRFLRHRVLRNTLTSMMRGSRLRFGMIAFCSGVFWVGLFGLFYGSFEFIDTYGALSGEFVEYIFSLFFLSLLIMLFFSSGILVYTGLFQSKEAAFLLATPSAPDRIFAHKFTEASAFSSWAFMLLSTPMLVAYGLISRAPLGYHVASLAYLLAFVLIPGSLGAATALLVARFLPRRKKTVLIGLALVVVVGGIARLSQVWQAPSEGLTSEWLDSLLGRLSFSRHPLLPSRWMAKGLVEAAAGNASDTLFYFFVVAAHAGLFYLFASTVARDLYRPAYSRVQGDRTAKRKTAWYGFDALFHRAFWFLGRPIRLLILKDLRTFVRDPAQWSQFLIFFGLLALYFINIRRLSYDLQKPYWRNLVSFLNLGVTSLILSTFTSRFIYPLLSLEGRNFWILGLLPLKRESILWGKFVFSAGIALPATELLIVLSDSMLRMGTFMTLLHMGMVAILCFGLSGISVGLGAKMPDFKEEDPSKIAAGFGGTLNLLVSLVFIASVVTALAIPCHLYFVGQDDSGLGSGIIDRAQFTFWVSVAGAASLVIGAIATIVPLRIGIRAFQRIEF
ncbi:MAG: hypothetical protein SFX72_05645 [Isosphaeraceae bacterium]|nr:hypothetical protein [Isosphaeraceae bacterium]